MSLKAIRTNEQGSTTTTTSSLNADKQRKRCLSDISELVLLRDIDAMDRGRSQSAQSMPDCRIVPEIVITSSCCSLNSCPAARSAVPLSSASPYDLTVDPLSTSRKLSNSGAISKSANELSLHQNNSVDLSLSAFPTGNGNADNLPRCKSLETSNVFDRGKAPQTLRRSNSVDNASQSSTLKSHQEFILSGVDSDFDVEDENRPWSARFPTSSLSTHDIKRQDVIAEFIHTEKTFLRCLLLLQKAYQEPLETHSIINSALSNRIFLNLSSLVDLHRGFKNDLVSLQGSNEYVDSIGPYISKFLSNPEFEKEIVKYCINLTDSLMVLKEKMRNTDFAAFLLECESNPQCRRKHLKELLPNPMQRVTKYPLLIQQIHKYTKTATEEHNRMTECLEKIKDICSNINKEVARAESQRIEKSARARLLAEDMNREIGEVILNMPVYCDDVKLDVNLVLFEKFIVLFPNDRAFLYSSAPPADTHIEKFTRVIAVDQEDVLISADKQESKSFYLISKAMPLICPIICKTEEECKILSQTLERAKNKEVKVKPVVEFLDLEVAQVHERNRPPSIPNEDDERSSVSIDQRGGDFELQSSNSTESNESTAPTFQQRLDKTDAQIFTLLTYKLGVMQEYYGSRKLPAGARGVPQSLNQLTSDANTLHEVALELLDSYEGEDKNTKLTKIRSSFQSLVSNVEFISQSVLVGSGGGDSEVVVRSTVMQQDEVRMRRGSFFERILPWKSKEDPPPGTELVTKRSSKKHNNRSRANTNSPLKLSPKSSTESLNKVSCNRLSSCSHYSTDSELDCQVDGTATVKHRHTDIPPLKLRSAPHVTSGTRSLSKASARHPNRTSTFQELFRRSTMVASEAERPVITGPVLQHTTNKMISTAAVDTG
ncbi:rho guanine nucleotide exchange factor 12-like isoform X2 [Bolinopsis microptera]|uniref:rho guanine nucleotide exchange factor 12-like isoform X2 n=1 Tax=Bolinopsis microptera TaxID=2820187 RepID=UPI0030797DC6